MRSSFVEASAWARTLVLLLSVFTTLALADVEFTEPSAGANLSAGLIDVRWEDSGIKPPISELTQYTLSLMVGGNDLDDMQPLATFESQGSFSTGYSVQGTIPAGIAAELPNGFFFRMTSTKQAGGVLINYSDRFSINNLSGESALKIKQAVLALNGDTDGPPAEGNDASTDASSTMTSGDAASTTTSSILDATTTTSDVTTTHFTHTETSDTAPAESTETVEEGNSSSGLSKGAVAGIAVAVTAIIMGSFASIALFIYKRKRKAQIEVEEIEPGSPFSQKAMSELSAEELVPPKTLRTRTTELSSETMIYEAGSGERPPELDCMTTFRAELEGSQPSTPK